MKTSFFLWVSISLLAATAFAQVNPEYDRLNTAQKASYDASRTSAAALIKSLEDERDALATKVAQAAADKAAALAAQKTANDAVVAQLTKERDAAVIKLKAAQALVVQLSALQLAQVSIPPRPLIGAKLDGNETAQMIASRDRFTAFVGQAPKMAQVFMSAEGWSTPSAEFIAASYWIPRADDLAIPLEFAVALCPKALVAGVNVLARDVIPGTKDAEFRRAALVLAAIPQNLRLNGKVLIRGGWECNVVPAEQWYEWQDDPETFKEAWKRFVGIFRGVSPDAFEFVLNFNAGDDDVVKWYPGPEWVNRITLDWYSPNTASFEAARDHPTSGFNRIVALARANGHSFAISELGITANNGPVLAQVWQWVGEQTDPKVDYVCWWDSTAPDTRISTGLSGTTGEVFRQFVNGS